MVGSSINTPLHQITILQQRANYMNSSSFVTFRKFIISPIILVSRFLRFQLQRSLHYNKQVFKSSITVSTCLQQLPLFVVSRVSVYCFWYSKFTGADPGFGQGGPQLLRLKVADVAKWSHASGASNLWLGSRARLRALEAFGFLMLKYAFSHILETLFLSFLTSILTPNVDKNRALEFTSINLRHSYILHLFFNLHEKVML